MYIFVLYRLFEKHSPILEESLKDLLAEFVRVETTASFSTVYHIDIINAVKVTGLRAM